MTVLAPLLLLAASALAVPLLVHLLRREDPRTRTFPALRYLARTVEERSRTLRLRQFLLLALRIGLVALVVLAAARLVLPVGSGTHPSASVVLVVDNGVHSGAVVDGDRVLDHLVRRGEEALAALGPLDRVWVVHGGEPWRSSRPLSPSEARGALALLEPAPTLSSLPSLLERARALLAPAPDGPAHIVILSTLAEGTLGGGTRPGLLAPEPTPRAGVTEAVGTEGPPVLLQGPGVDLPPNRGIASVRIGGGLTPRAGEASSVEVQVVGSEVEDLPVRLLLEGELVTAGRTDPGGRVTLALPPQPSGWLRGSVELEPDALRADDRREFAAEVRPPPVVRTQGDIHPFLNEALETLADAGRLRIAAGGGPSPEVVLQGGDTGAAGPLIPPLDAVVTRVVLPPSDPSLLPALNRLLEGWEVPWRLEPGDPEARAPLQDATGYPPSLAGVETSRAFALRPVGTPMGAEIVWEDGEPWLVRIPARAPMRGEVVLLASALDPTTSALPLSAAMIPFLDRLLTPSPAGIGVGIGGTGHPAGRPLPLPTAAASVQRPDGTLVPVDGIPRLLDTGAVGTVAILDPAGALLGAVALQVPEAAVLGAESRSVQEVSDRLGHGVAAAPEGPAWVRRILPDRRGREVAPFLAFAALLLLLIEGWLASGTRTLTRNSPDRTS